MPCVANKENALDSIKAGARELAQSIDDDGRSLGVSLENDAFGCVLTEDFADLVDQLKQIISFAGLQRNFKLTYILGSRFAVLIPSRLINDIILGDVSFICSF